MLKLGIDPEKLYQATFICQYGLCCCNMALVSFRLFRKNLGHLREFFGQMVYRPPWQKISRTPMGVHLKGDVTVSFAAPFCPQIIKQITPTNQLRPSARLITLTSTLIIPGITKTLSIIIV